MWNTIDLWAMEFSHLGKNVKMSEMKENDGKRRKYKKKMREYKMCLYGRMNYDRYLSFICRTPYIITDVERKKKHLLFSSVI